MLSITPSDIIQIVGASLAVPGALLTCFELKRRFVLIKKADFEQGKKDKVYSSLTKPYLPFFDKYLIKRLPMKVATRDAKRLAKKMIEDHYFPTIIVGIGRGGSIFGSMLSYNLYQVPIFSVDRAYEWQKKRVDSIMFDFEIPPRFLDRVLLVSGEVHSGNTMSTFTNYLNHMGAKEIRTCTLYQQNTSTTVIDYNLTKGIGIPFMPWQDKFYLRDSIDAEKSHMLRQNRASFTSRTSKTVYIMRHGETLQNKNDIFIGGRTEETDLTPDGIEQARNAGMILRRDIGGGLVNIYCSTQKRCIETANLVSKALNANVFHCDQLKERDYGIWENISRAELAGTPEYRLYLANPMKSNPEGSEPMQDAISRVLDFWQGTVLHNDQNKTCVVITHKTTGRLLLSYLMNSPYTMFRNITLDNDSVIKVVIEGEKIDCEYLR